MPFDKLLCVFDCMYVSVYTHYTLYYYLRNLYYLYGTTNRTRCFKPQLSSGPFVQFPKPEHTSQTGTHDHMDTTSTRRSVDRTEYYHGSEMDLAARISVTYFAAQRREYYSWNPHGLLRQSRGHVLWGVFIICDQTQKPRGVGFCCCLWVWSAQIICVHEAT